VSSNHLMQLAMILVFTALVAMRLYFRSKVGFAANRPRVGAEGAGVVVLRMVLTGLLGAVVGLETTWPAHTWFLRWPLVEAARWIGLPVAVAGLALLWRTHRALGADFSPTLMVREEAQLVTWGPYARVRHPMYVAYLVIFAGAGLLVANWAIFLLGAAVIGLLMSVRLRKEEAMLREAFGRSYEEYERRVPRFLPRLVRRERRSEGRNAEPAA